ncbi:hypothetical protein SASPL_139285 [Salvia splendens]|uniref:Uncharacterized protein n=1 Tax=Salvia splendens TaxID=180675 RepID=A0A8X8WN85_SALSN|nr:hypothetical protein SASPL_139285 [Salvia splendens]
MDHSPNPFPLADDGGEKPTGPENLLDNRWFFNNPLDKKVTMSENKHVDTPRPAGKSYDETYESIMKLSRPPTTLMKAPPSLERKNSEKAAPAMSNLARGPSMPASLPSEEEEEIEFSMGKLIRQASLKSTRPTINHGVPSIVSSNTPSPRKVEFANRKLERLRPRRAMNQLKSQKSLSDLQSLELQGFKDLGFDVGVTKLQSAITMIPESHEEEEHGRNAPKWGSKGSKEDDMKAQIKFWARAVASNVNQD